MVRVDALESLAEEVRDKEGTAELDIDRVTKALGLGDALVLHEGDKNIVPVVDIDCVTKTLALHEVVTECEEDCDLNECVADNNVLDCP